MLKKKIMAYVHQLLDQPSQWQTSQQAGPCSVPKFTNTSITIKHLLIKNKNINQSKSSLLIWHYVSYLFLLYSVKQLNHTKSWVEFICSSWFRKVWKKIKWMVSCTGTCLDWKFVLGRRWPGTYSLWALNYILWRSMGIHFNVSIIGKLREM